MKKLLILFLILFLAGCIKTNINNKNQVYDLNTDTEIQSNEVKNIEGYKGELIAGSKTPYIRYSKEDFDKAKSEGKVIYLYFYATWCPICARERPSIFQAFNEMNYDNAVGFEVHFNDGKTTKDDEDLARELGIAYQHTTIIFNKEGNEAFRSLSSIKKDEIKEEIVKLI